MPNIRFVICPRTGTGEEVWNVYKDKLYKALTDPLTDKEKSSGIYTPPPEPRICFEGTYDDAQAFFLKTTSIDLCGKCPITTWTDGLPIIIPTEEKVKEMMTGTSHKTDEWIKPYTYDATTGKYTQSTSNVAFQPDRWISTVEKVAVNAVMAGCKPQYLPVVLAMATTGCGTGSTHFQNPLQVVSGPIAKEIGMNAGIGVLSGGNQANATTGRAFQLMATNLGDQVIGMNKMNTQGGVTQRAGICFADNTDGEPPGWLAFNEEMGYPKTASVIYSGSEIHSVLGDDTSPGGYRSLQAGVRANSVTLRVQVLSGEQCVGVPGPHNWLWYNIPDLWSTSFCGLIILMNPEMALDLQKYGFKTKQAVYDWINSVSFVPKSRFIQYGWYGFRMSDGTAIEATSGKPYNDLPDDYMISANCPSKGMTPFNRNWIFITGGVETEYIIFKHNTNRTAYPIDPWR